MALTFIGWSSWEAKLALFEELALPAPMAWMPRSGVAAAQQQQQQQQQVPPCRQPLVALISRAEQLHACASRHHGRRQRPMDLQAAHCPLSSPAPWRHEPAKRVSLKRGPSAQRVMRSVVVAGSMKCSDTSCPSQTNKQYESRVLAMTAKTSRILSSNYIVRSRGARRSRRSCRCWRLGLPASCTPSRRWRTCSRTSCHRTTRASWSPRAPTRSSPWWRPWACRCV